jgi:hypothetical protein
VVAIEEVLLAGIPTLVIDPKGDLGNLLLTFPELKPDDFAPWVEGGDPAEVAKRWSEGLARLGRRAEPHRAAALNGLLASPSFAARAQGPGIDLDGRLRAHDGDRPACAIVALTHLSDPERQFVVSLLLGKLITWMRRQPGTDQPRVLVYLDEVMGFVPPTGMPPAKKPILTLFKTARAYGVGLVLATQNPVDVDCRGLSNAGTWMIGRLQTEQDKARLLDGLSSAGGSVDVVEMRRLNASARPRTAPSTARRS